MRRLGMIGLIALLCSCSSDVGERSMAINDPLDLIDDVQGPLRLFVLDAETYGCDATTGLVTPEVPDLPEGMFDDAFTDVSLPVAGSQAMTEVDVPEGERIVLVRGKGTDPVSGRMDVFIATGCAPTTIASGETREVRITLLPIVGMGVCGDGTLSPDEQCEDSNTADGDGCSASCRVEPIAVNTTTGGAQEHPQVAGAAGQRWFVGYDSDNSTSLLRVLEGDGSAVSMPSALAPDGDIDTALADISTGSQLQSSFAVSAAGRVAWAFTDFNPPREVRVAFTNQDRLPEGPSAVVGEIMTGGNPRIAFEGGGAAMVVYEDAASSTGLTGAVVPAGMTAPGATFEVGAAGSSAPEIAGTASGFVVVFTSGASVSYQRFGADGSPVDGTPVEVAPGSAADVAAMADGSFVVAFESMTIDGEGAGVGYRHFGGDGMPTIEATALNTTTAGAQGAPAVAAGADGYVVAFTSDAGVRARLLSPMGDPIPNREAPPTTADFQVSAAGAEPDVAAGGDGDFLVVWTESRMDPMTMVTSLDIRGLLHPLP